jgi:hypothetical protein
MANGMMKNKTHFEQVPLELVKQIANQSEFSGNGLDAKEHGTHEEPNWKQLCHAIISEEDPKQISALAEQLDKTLAQRSKPASE